MQASVSLVSNGDLYRFIRAYWIVKSVGQRGTDRGGGQRGTDRGKLVIQVKYFKSDKK